MTPQSPPVEHPAGQRARATGWTIAYWMLTAAFLLTAGLNLLHVRAGFLTNYLADLTLPAWLYILSRRLVPGQSAPVLRWMPWIGRTPESAAIFFFLASSATEFAQIIWPRGFFAGRFDPWDIAAYAAGLLACYLCDKFQGTGRRQGEKFPEAVQQKFGD